MNPLDLLKVKFQVATTNPTGGVGKQIWYSLRDIQRQEGWKGLYRGLGPNIAGKCIELGTLLLIKRATDGDPSAPLSSGSILLCSAQASAVTAIMTNPIWVVKVRMFTTRSDSPNAYRGVVHGFSSIIRSEGVLGLFRGTSLALFGVSNGALQFVVYERMKRWGFEVKKKQFELAGRPWTTEVDKLSNTAYSVMSGGSKIAALALTYPYQVVRSRIQNNATSHIYPTIPATIRRTWAQEGVRGFYRGLATNLPAKRDQAAAAAKDADA
ncbi:mitochondrial carrier domain-containing protein [Mycena filopes]|nr:mitochondrial carrier domain-containing protein [Mycena filopes]